MKNLLITLITISSLQIFGQRIVVPTNDLSLNFGINSLKQQVDVNSMEADLIPYVFNLNFTSNQAYGRHIFEIGASLKNDLDITLTNSNQLKTADFLSPSINYSYNHQIFAYHPSCQIANQVFAGIRLNAESYMTNLTTAEATLESFSDYDFFEYSLGLSIGTDYNFDKRNYATFQFYLPFLHKVNLPNHSDNNSLTAFDDRKYDSDYFTAGDLSFFDEFNKFGAIVSYRMMFNDAVGILLKYHYQNLKFTDKDVLADRFSYEMQAHQLTLGLLLHKS